MNNFYALLHSIESLVDSGLYEEALAVIDANLTHFPSRSEEILECAYDVAQKNPDKSRYAQYQKRFFHFDIKPGDKVLDMGSGHIPFPSATHLADISVTDHHAGRAGIPFKYQGDKPVFECDVERTPFADKEFDFVYCSHVLEHAKNPEAACRELIRIGKRGYIECPTRGKDVFFNTASFSNHLWAVECVNGVLSFVEYADKDALDTGCTVLLDMNCRPRNRREKCIAALDVLRADRFNVMLLWENSFAYEVRRKAPWPASVQGPTAGTSSASHAPDATLPSPVWLLRKKTSRFLKKLRSKLVRILEH